MQIIRSCADDLRSTISGCVALPGHELYDAGSLTGMRDVVVDPRAHVATVAGCVRAKDVAAAAGAHGLVAALGNCGMVGMAGLSLGGGDGPFSGSCGLAADNLLGALQQVYDRRIS